ncbi:hypothetical protein PLICRDRAFT_57000 [Plicaturopsis crispa FD-325 SS-3]|uniref:Uncharacterized protein n=1 Tax=Plicaturopsis crispa FD-325 SS-3 TaxID=944288 RepID=A0A0C9T6V7_PLICR|nr:hypothetical protein PLICRDRAFT_57000 [Plicaturopsis crispa FD-325 SS-3]
MQTRRPSAVPPLAIVLPHPSLPRRRSSLLSATATSPRTPRSCGSPTCSSIFLASNNRKSTDSWNSSNQDDQEWEWKPEQTSLLSRTLDALPAHLTPFNGPVPPSNLLDKIARGISQAKGPLDWPHSVRATRLKLVELARLQAKEAAAEKRRRGIAEEDDDYVVDSNGEVLQTTTNMRGRRPLYRQSSMEFMNSAKPDHFKDNDNLLRLSSRLQRSDRYFSNPAYHPYSRPSPAHSRSRSPHAPHLSTASSTTLASSFGSSASSTAPLQPSLRRAASFLSSADSSVENSKPEDPRVQRVRRSDSFCAPTPKGTQRSGPLKRAPSFGASSSTDAPAPSSDEEEKARTRKAKKARTKTMSPATPPPSSPALNSPASRTRSKTKKANTATSRSESISPNKADALKSPSRQKRNPSTLGLESPTSPASNNMQPPRTLRRVRATSFARAPARRISFGSLATPAEEDHENEPYGAAFGGPLDGGQSGLGSAFQLQ